MVREGRSHTARSSLVTQRRPKGDGEDEERRKTEGRVLLTVGRRHQIHRRKDDKRAEGARRRDCGDDSERMHADEVKVDVDMSLGCTAKPCEPDHEATAIARQSERSRG